MIILYTASFCNSTHAQKDGDRQPVLLALFPGRRRLKKLLAAYAAGEIPLERVTASARGWANHARYGNTVGLRKVVLESVVIPATLMAG